MRALRLVVALAGLAGSVGCRASPLLLDSARDVLTLRGATISELRDRRGSGPRHRYEAAPDEMLEVLAAACRRGRDLAGRPVTGVTVSRRYAEVVAKERAPGAPADPGYAEDWRTAVVAIVFPVPGEPGRSDVEWHAACRSPLLGGAIDWPRRLPGWIEEELAARRAAPADPGRPGPALTSGCRAP